MLNIVITGKKIILHVDYWENCKEKATKNRLSRVQPRKGNQRSILAGLGGIMTTEVLLKRR